MDAKDVYHEKQCKQLCALHAINNLFQSTLFTKTDLDLICFDLSPNSRFMNPHKSALGLGNYDINVIMTALHLKQHEAIWFDKRKDPNVLVLENIKGFILNISNLSCKKWSPSSILSLTVNLLSSRKHWITIRSFNGTYFNLDSKLDSPQLIGKENELIELLREKNSAKDTEIFVVVSERVAENKSWINS